MLSFKFGWVRKKKNNIPNNQVNSFIVYAQNLKLNDEKKYSFHTCSFVKNFNYSFNKNFYSLNYSYTSYL